MAECGPKSLARVHDRGRTLATRQVLVEKFGSDAANCVECGECMEKCPFDLEIPALMKKADDMFG